MTLEDQKIKECSSEKRAKIKLAGKSVQKREPSCWEKLLGPWKACSAACLRASELTWTVVWRTGGSGLFRVQTAGLRSCLVFPPVQHKLSPLFLHLTPRDWSLHPRGGGGGCHYGYLLKSSESCNSFCEQRCWRFWGSVNSSFSPASLWKKPNRFAADRISVGYPI